MPLRGAPGDGASWLADAHRPSDLSLLLVDDEKNVLQSMALLLGDCGYRVRSAASAAEARRILGAETFDIVFVDQFLGPARGIDLMQEFSSGGCGTSFVIITANGTAELAVEAMRQGAADFVTKPFTAADLVRSIGYVQKKRDLDRERLEMLNSLEKEVERKTTEVRRLFYGILSSFAQAMEKRDFGTYGHCRRVSTYAGMVAAAIGLDEENCIRLKTAATLHDIGKIGISDFILGKPGPLTEDEWHVVRDHPSRGVDILRPIPQFTDILPGILHHHERYDGSGYPDGLAGEDIPLPARIIAIADTYDAILSERPYRGAADRAQAIGELTSGAGTQFDPEIVRAFVAADERYRGMFETPERW